MAFQKRAPEGIEPDAGEEGVAPITKVKKPAKKKKGKPKKHSVAKEGQKGKIAEMLGSKYCGKELDFSGKRGVANRVPEGFGRNGAVQFVPEQKRMGVRG